MNKFTLSKLHRAGILLFSTQPLCNLTTMATVCTHVTG